MKGLKNPPFGKEGKAMKHNLKISVSKTPKNGGIVAYRKVGIREKILSLLLGPKQNVMVLVPGDTVESIAITEVADGGGCGG